MALKDIGGPLRGFLLADSTIAGLVGNVRIFPMVLPQGEVRPSIVYSEVTEVSPVTMDGPSFLVFGRYQIDAWAQTRDAAIQLADEVKERLNGAAGAWGSVNVQGVFLANGFDAYDAESKMYRRSRDYFIDFEDS